MHTVLAAIGTCRAADVHAVPSCEEPVGERTCGCHNWRSKILTQVFMYSYLEKSLSLLLLLRGLCAVYIVHVSTCPVSSSALFIPPSLPPSICTYTLSQSLPSFSLPPIFLHSSPPLPPLPSFFTLSTSPLHLFNHSCMPCSPSLHLYPPSEQKLIRQKVDVLPICATVEAEDGLRALPVKLLDCDTISQAKEKLLDSMHKAAPVSKRPKLTEVDLGTYSKTYLVPRPLLCLRPGPQPVLPYTVLRTNLY